MDIVKHEYPNNWKHTALTTCTMAKFGGIHRKSEALPAKNCDVLEVVDTSRDALNLIVLFISTGIFSHGATPQSYDVLHQIQSNERETPSLVMGRVAISRR
jgi:hypothetical protein